MACILFVDDDLTALHLFSTACQMLGHEALVTDSGRRAAALAAEQQPDLILLDLLLQDGNGLDVLRQLRRQPVTARIPVVVLSAGVSADDAAAAKKAGAQAYLSKPVTLKKLSDTITQYISSG